MNIAVDGNNFFHTGWLACLLGLPRGHPASASLRPVDVAAFKEGWDTCHETPDEAMRMYAFDKMRASGQASVYWQADDGSEVEP